VRRRTAAEPRPDIVEIIQFRRDARRAMAAAEGDAVWSRERVAFELSGWVEEHPLPPGLPFEELVDAYFDARRPDRRGDQGDDLLRGLVERSQDR
jgi:hypothetical protein